MTLLLAADDPLSETLSVRIAEVFSSLRTASASTPEQFARAIESRPFEIVVVTAALLRGLEESRRALLAESEVVLVTDDPKDSIRLRADDFVIVSRDVRELAEELLVRVATALHRLDRRLFSKLPTPELLREALLEAEETQPTDSPAMQQAFDLGSFAASYGDSPEIMREILRLYLDEAPQRLESMRKGLTERDFARVAKAAHSLANTSGTLQSDRAVRAARKLEEAARREDHESSKAAATALQSVVEAMLSDISDVVEGED